MAFDMANLVQALILAFLAGLVWGFGIFKQYTAYSVKRKRKLPWYLKESGLEIGKKANKK